MRDATLFIVKNGEHILLGMKKTGFGSGKYNGFGGKVEPGETIKEAAIRELEEESGIAATPEHTTKHAELTFKFPHKQEWNQIVHVYATDKWDGKPTESNEMAPEWFHQNELPYDRMWVDDKHWLPHVLSGKYVTATFTFAEEGHILEQELTVNELRSKN